MSEHLTSGRVNTSLLQESAANELIYLLNKCDGPKVIVMDEGLMKPLNLIIKYSLVGIHGVKDVSNLSHGKLRAFRKMEENVIFITRPFLPQMEMISENICSENHEDRKHGLYHLFFVPTRSIVCENHLEKEGVLKTFVQIKELRFLLFPLENDLMSMEMNDSYKEIYLENDPTCLYRVAQAIVLLEDLYGRIDRVTGKGRVVNQVWDLVSKIPPELRKPNSKVDRNYKSIDHLVLIDRSVDLMTPMVTQLTFEGLIDELFGIDCCTVDLPANKILGPEEVTAVNTSTTKTIELTSNEEIFAETRNHHFNAVLLNLNKRAKDITTVHDDKSLQGRKHLISRLPYVLSIKKQLATYISIAGLVKELTDKTSFRDLIKLQQGLISGTDYDNILPQIDDLISIQVDLITVLRLICTQCAVNSGLKQRVWTHYKREIIQTYGFEHLVTLTNLEKSGLIKQQTSLRTYANCRQPLKLVSEPCEVDPDDIHYVHGTYAPLSVRLVQHISKWDSKVLTEIQPFLPGPTLEHVNPEVDQSFNTSYLVDTNKVVLVFFIGGCTFSEIAALRFLSSLEDSTIEYIIATTNITNGNKMIKTLLIPELNK